MFYCDWVQKSHQRRTATRAVLCRPECTINVNGAPGLVCGGYKHLGISRDSSLARRVNRHSTIGQHTVANVQYPFQRTVHKIKIDTTVFSFALICMVS